MNVYPASQLKRWRDMIASCDTALAEIAEGAQSVTVIVAGGQKAFTRARMGEILSYRETLAAELKGMENANAGTPALSLTHTGFR